MLPAPAAARHFLEAYVWQTGTDVCETLISNFKGFGRAIEWNRGCGDLPKQSVESWKDGSGRRFFRMEDVRRDG